jgi:glyoxylase-like metal-dependent hydrolase (beta-lactamase superfamily II)
VLIDPGHSKIFGHVRDGLSQLGLKPEDIGLIICTHAHLDHIEGVALFNKTPAHPPTLIAIHESAWQFVKRMGRYVNATFGKADGETGPDFFIKEGDLSVGGIRIDVFHTPGHSPGSVCLYLPDQKLLFTGDLIFKAGIGRTDIPGGISTQLKESIQRVSEMDIEWILPGHGDVVSGKQDVKANFDHIKRFWFNYL